MVAGFDPLGPRDVVFIPVAVNYDRVLEDRMLTSVANVEPGKKPVFGFNAPTLARHFFRHVWMAIRGEWYRFGYTCVSFGVPVSLRNYVEKKIARILRHCDRVIDVHCTLTVEKLRHEAETTIRLSGTTVHAATVHDDMYAAIDLMADKLDEQVRRHKEKHRDPQAARHRHGTGISP